eukprot:CAMPEP_0184740174 /NCGR_PEP_ID=MMETSP0315-20130426/3178_1 /TAXON_ID=101924 /ORGANISM="Rhodosorus marinus, Strain UTEX LB 2760" /LENGTH=56 /DNA_ID=CAMNT_0027209673 /DNA_START=179 /DNA_END=346 /DNA_ORIENTATION=+
MAGTLHQTMPTWRIKLVDAFTALLSSFPSSMVRYKGAPPPDQTLVLPPLKNFGTVL